MVNSILLYGASIWSNLSGPSEIVQRRIILRFASVYYTKSTDAGLVIKGNTPQELQAWERKIIYDGSKLNDHIEIRNQAKKMMFRSLQEYGRKIQKESGPGLGCFSHGLANATR